MAKIDWKPYRGKIVEALFDHYQCADWAIVRGRVVDPPARAKADEMALEAPDGRLLVTYYIREITKVLDDWPDAPLAEWCHGGGDDCSAELYGAPTWQANPGLYSGYIVSASTPADRESPRDRQISFTGRVVAVAPPDAPADIAEAVVANRVLCFEAPDGRWFATDDVSVYLVRDRWPFEYPPTKTKPNSSYEPLVSWNWRPPAGRPDPEQFIYGPPPEYSSEPGGTPLPDDVSLAGRLIEIETDGRRLVGILTSYTDGSRGDQLEGATFWPAESGPIQLGPARFVSTHRRWPPIDPDEVPAGRILDWDRAFEVMDDPRRQAVAGEIVELFVLHDEARSGNQTQVIGRLERWAEEIAPGHEFVGAVLSDAAGNEIREFNGRVVAVYTRWPDGRHMRQWVPPGQEG